MLDKNLKPFELATNQVFSIFLSKFPCISGIQRVNNIKLFFHIIQLIVVLLAINYY